MRSVEMDEVEEAFQEASKPFVPTALVLKSDAALAAARGGRQQLQRLRADMLGDTDTASCVRCAFALTCEWMFSRPLARLQLVRAHDQDDDGAALAAWRDWMGGSERGAGAHLAAGRNRAEARRAGAGAQGHSVRCRESEALCLRRLNSYGLDCRAGQTWRVKDDGPGGESTVTPLDEFGKRAAFVAVL